MAFRARDGKPFGNAQKQRAYDERSSVKNHPAKRSSKDASDQRQGHERKEYGGSLESKPHQPPEEVDTQNRRGDQGAANPNPGPREPSPSSPDPAGEGGDNPGHGAADENDLSTQNIQDVVRQHGVATGVQIRSSGGLHHVTTTHGKGLRHVSTHPTPHAAAQHVGDAMGINQHMAEQTANPEMEDQIPGMGGGQMRIPHGQPGSLPRY